MSRLTLSRDQVLAHRRRVGALDERIPYAPASLRRVAWAGLQDSVPRAALLAIHARVRDTRPDSWEDPALVQVWGPRWAVFVVAAEDHGVFTLGTLPDDRTGRERSEALAAQLHAFLDGRRMTYSEAGHTLGMHPAALRYTGATGTVLIRWDGARQPEVWSVPRPEISPWEARLELARRYLHVVGPQTAAGFAWWAGINPKRGREVCEALGSELVPVATPLGEAFLPAADEAAAQAAPGEPAAARLLSSGDPYLMAADRELLVPDPVSRRALWPAGTVWPGGLLVDGELVATWRRSMDRMTISPWRSLTSAERAAVEAEAASLPLPGVPGPMRVTYAG